MMKTAKLGLTRLSSKGQVVIPKRLRFGLEEGTFFTVARKDDIIVLKKVDPWLEKFEKLCEEGRKIVKKTGLKPSDVPKIVHRIRGVEE